jgi:GTPase
METEFRCGFAGIIGPPNAGKSTLLNQVLGQKISITSPKPQTTRDRILGIVNRTASQIILVDTPGIHRSTTLLNQRIVDQALHALGEVDVVLLVVDGAEPDFVSEKRIVARLLETGQPVILVVNKIDIAARAAIFKRAEDLSRKISFRDVVPISARQNIQVDTLMAELEKNLPVGPRLFPEETFTDVTEKFLVRELIREKVFRLTGMEIPYSSAVSMDAFEVEKRLIVIHATIHVARDSQKGIIIGKKGAMLTRIGSLARLDMEKMLGKKVLLKLFVKVSKDWVSSPRSLEEFGY